MGGSMSKKGSELERDREAARGRAEAPLSPGHPAGIPHTYMQGTQMTLGPPAAAEVAAAATVGADGSLIPTVFRWELGGGAVYITGTFNGWSRRVAMVRSGNDFVHITDLPRGRHAYKFIVDEEWRFAPDQPTVSDAAGNINNYIDLTNFRSDDDDAPSRARRDSPAGVYACDLPDEDEYSKEPAALPPHLRMIPLNAASPDPIDAQQLPVPAHVTLNHLYCLCECMQVLTHTGFAHLRTLERTRTAALRFATYDEASDTVRYERARALIVNEPCSAPVVHVSARHSHGTDVPGPAASVTLDHDMYVRAVDGEDTSKAAYAMYPARELLQRPGAWQLRCSAAAGMAAEDGWAANLPARLSELACHDANHMDTLLQLLGALLCLVPAAACMTTALAGGVELPCAAAAAWMQQVLAQLGLEPGLHYRLQYVTESLPGLLVVTDPALRDGLAELCIPQREDACGDDRPRFAHIPWLPKQPFFSTNSKLLIDASSGTACRCCERGADRLPAWMLALPRSASGAVLRGMAAMSFLDGDVNSRGNAAITVLTLPHASASLTSDVVQLGLHAAFAATMRALAPSSAGGWQVVLSRRANDQQPIMQSPSDIRCAQHTGRTWCVQVPSGRIIVRSAQCDAAGTLQSAGAPVIVGNCTAIKDNLMVQALTQRYRRKFVTTVFYTQMPIAGSLVAVPVTPGASVADIAQRVNEATATNASATSGGFTPQSTDATSSMLGTGHSGGPVSAVAAVDDTDAAVYPRQRGRTESEITVPTTEYDADRTVTQDASVTAAMSVLSIRTSEASEAVSIKALDADASKDSPMSVLTATPAASARSRSGSRTMHPTAAHKLAAPTDKATQYAQAVAAAMAAQMALHAP